MNNDLIERYVYAVTKNMSSKIRHDIANEIRSIIDDMLEKQCTDITPTEQDILVVLTKLGTPCELEDKYNQDSIKCLIGGSHYIQYKSLLKTVLPCVVLD